MSIWLSSPISYPSIRAYNPALQPPTTIRSFVLTPPPKCYFFFRMRPSLIQPMVWNKISKFEHYTPVLGPGLSNCLYSGGKQHLGQEKPLISPINLAQISNPRTVLKSARPEDSKTPPEC